MRWIICGEAADLVHQGCPIPISDFDKAILASGSICNFKVGKLQPQYLPTLHSNHFGPLKVGRIVPGEVWRSEHTFDNKFLQNFLHHSPSLPQPSTGQSESIGCQSPAPVVESRTQARLSQGESEHWPQQQCSPSSYLQSSASRFEQGLPGYYLTVYNC